MKAFYPDSYPHHRDTSQFYHVSGLAVVLEVCSALALPGFPALPMVPALPGAVDRGQEVKSQPVRSLGMVPACPWLRSPSSQTAKGRTPFAGRLGLGG
ncbi:MAG: hypothetical protein NTX45_15245 [Proteobacteria bacterium]|nr:hypothetical protein [Pseudomonadota bacterium]